jgi:hypothetical protein
MEGVAQVRAEFDYFGLRSKVEDFILGYEKDLFLYLTLCWQISVPLCCAFSCFVVLSDL